MDLGLETALADLGDKRLNKRLNLILERSETHPNLSIPAAMHSRAEMEAAYRFFANESVTPEKILAPHYAMTKKRIAEHSVCLLVQDTTELDLTRPNQQMRGAGPMSSNAQFGAFVHPLMAFATDGIPLGLVWQKIWARDAIATDVPIETKKKKRNEHLRSATVVLLAVAHKGGGAKARPRHEVGHATRVLGRAKAASISRRTFTARLAGSYATSLHFRRWPSAMSVLSLTLWARPSGR